ncbi:hypothetical protein IJJ12_03690 [bacterium]|nr:hypothetical protein [bacterium]
MPQDNQQPQVTAPGRQNNRPRLINDSPAMAVDGSMVTTLNNRQLSIRFLQNVGQNQGEVNMMVAAHVRLDQPGVAATVKLLQDALEQMQAQQEKEMVDASKKD